MPMVEIKWFKGRSAETKQKIVDAIEQAMQAHAGCKLGDTQVVFQDIDKENWAMAGKLKL